MDAVGVGVGMGVKNMSLDCGFFSTWFDGKGRQSDRRSPSVNTFEEGVRANCFVIVAEQCSDNVSGLGVGGL